ncbi:MAG: hypothetical protein GF329_01485 [Candidatus Lokiarchaeota archaeon]|nr:hypothetical protein [Candidatus Lokiarchaeota archaeon]
MSRKICETLKAFFGCFGSSSLAGLLEIPSTYSCSKPFNTLLCSISAPSPYHFISNTLFTSNKKIEKRASFQTQHLIEFG